MFKTLGGLVVLVSMACNAGDDLSVQIQDVPEEEPPYFDLSVSFESGPDCLADRHELVLAAFARWELFGIHAHENSGILVSGGPTVVSVCITNHELWGGRRAGATSWGQHVRIEILGELNDLKLSKVAGHEFGHAILHSAEHLPKSVIGARTMGTMSSGLGTMTTHFTQDDFVFLEARGLVPIE